MRKIKLNDGTELNVICVNGNKVYHQSANRDSLEFVFKKGDYPFDELERLTSDMNKMKKISIIDTAMVTNAEGVSEPQEVEHVYNDYSMRVKMEMRPVQVPSDDPQKGEVTEERVMVTMAQLTLIEKKLMEYGML